MPFDGATYREPDPEPRRRRPVSDNAVSWAIALGATLLLLMPISVPALADILRYLRAH